MSKFFLYMAFLQSVFATVAFATSSGAQALEQVMISHDWNHSKLERAFADIQNQTDFYFTYTHANIAAARINSNREKQTSLADLLKMIAGQSQLRFSIQDEIIYVFKDGEEQKERSPNAVCIEIFSPSASMLSGITPEHPVIYEVAPANYHLSEIIRGDVRSAEEGSPLVGATILVKETGNGTVTDDSGNFSIGVPDEGKVTLLISYVGYQSKEIEVSNRTQLTIQLERMASELDEIVVLGYGVQKKVNLTGAVSTIDHAKIQNRPITQASQALYGLSPGVLLNASTGEAGNDRVSIRIRGVGTLNNANPLVLVDGIEAPIDNLNPDDIESINILKDAASAAIYGARAANGVILVTTKRGQFDRKASVSYHFFGGVSAPTVVPDMVTDNRTYLELYREAAENSNRSHRITDEVIERYAQLPGTDYLDLFFRNDAPIFQHNLSLNGGAENIAYNISLAYLDQEGIVIEQGFKRYNGRMNLDFKINDKLTAGTSLSFAHENAQLSPKEDGNTLNFKGYLGFEGSLVNHPIVPVYDEFGRYAQIELGLRVERSRENFMAGIDSRKPFLRENYFLGNAFVEYEILDGLKIKGTVGANYQQEAFSESKKEVTTYDWVTGERSYILNEDGYIREDRTNRLNITSWLQATYEKSFGDHDIKLLAGLNQESSDRDRIIVTDSEFPTPESFIALGDGIDESVNGQPGAWSLRSFFGRANYVFADKYLLEFNLRRDGSSRFGANNRWATFPSVSAGWVISEESFMKGLSGTVDFFKIRGSWGKLGNQNTSLYPFASGFSLNRNYVFNDSEISGGALTQLGNPDLKWEETSSTNVGLNLGLFDNRLRLEADYFVRKTEDILTELPNPLVLGVGASSVVNAGSVENKGWEASLNYQDKAGGLSWSLGLNFANVKNKITAINPNLAAGEDILNAGTSGADVYYWIRGESIGAMLGYVHEGIFQSEQEIETAADHSFIGSPSPGDLKFKDLNGDNVIDENDQTIIGDRQPELIYGFNLSLDYKGLIDFFALFQGIGPADVRLSQYAGPFPFAGLREVWTDRWTPESPSSDRPRIWLDRRGFNGETMLNKPSSFWVEDRSYLRLKNVQLGFNVPGQWLDRLFISKARIYLNGQNLLTITDFKDFDPERDVNQRRPTTSLPHAKVFTAGLNVTF